MSDHVEVLEKMESFYGKNVEIVLEDAVYAKTKPMDSDGDSNTKSSRLNADQQVVVRDLLINALKVSSDVAVNITKDIVSKDNVTLTLSPVQFSSILLSIQLTKSEYIKTVNYKPKEPESSYNLAPTGLR